MTRFDVSISDPEAIADALGEIKAKLAILKQREEELKTELIEAGIERIEGSLFRVCVSHSKIKRIDYRGLVERLEPSRQLVWAYTTEQERVQVRVTARNGKTN